jgi:oxalate---CoA ligase
VNARVEVSDDLLELEISALWNRLLRRDDIGLDEDFFDAGGDSITAVQMLLELETLSGRPYPESELAGLTIRRVAEVLKSRMPVESGCITRARAGVDALAFHADLEAADVWTRLRAVRRMAQLLKDKTRASAPSASVGVPFFFCHGDFQARGLYAHRLAALLPQDQPVYLLHPQREPPAGTTVEELASRYFEAVRRMAPGMPVILGGYCNGGYVAWHLAHLLRSKGVEVLGVFLVETPSFNARPLMRSLAALFRSLPATQELATRAVRSLYRHGAKSFAARALRAMGERLRHPRASRAASSWWTFVRGMSARYVPPALDVDIYCFLAEEGTRADNDPRRWQPLAARVTEIVVPGNHLSAVIAHRQALAAAFTEALEDACARSRHGAADRRLAA